MTKGFVYISEAMNHARQGHPDGWVIVESSDKMWSTEGGNGKPLRYSCPENPMNSMKRQKDMTPEDEPPKSEGMQYATGEDQRAIMNRCRKDYVGWTKQG